MNKLKRFYNQNRKTIWGMIIIIAFAFSLLQLANYFAKTKNEKEIQAIIAQREQQNKAKSENQTNITEQTNTVATNSNTQNSSTNKNIQTNTIRQFITYCNKKELENAYNMLTDDCKNEMYDDLEKFERLYYNSTFENHEKETEIKNWANNTYLVYFKESALATGKIKDENQKGDYITVVGDNDNYKLNINSYIGYAEINKIQEKEQIKIQVASRNVYMDYEEYKVIVTNNSKETVKLDKLENTESIYIQDTKNMHYPSYNHELSDALITVLSGHTKEIKIKFYSRYSSTRRINSLVFSNLLKGDRTIRYKIEL